MKDGPMVANAGLVTETEVRREMTSLGLKAYEAWREGGSKGRTDGGTERARERKEGFGGRDKWGGREERMGGRGRRERGKGKKVHANALSSQIQIPNSNLKVHTI